MNSTRSWPLIFLAGVHLGLAQPSASAQANTLLPVVSITATVTETMEPSPTTRVRPGEFTLQRLGSTNSELLVAVSFSGSATWGSDYEAPRYIPIAAGVQHATLLVGPVDDSLPEGDETVIATLVPTSAGAGVVRNYQIDPAHSQAALVIHDNEEPVSPLVSLELVRREAGETLINQNLILWAEFNVRRTGPTTNDLVVFLDAGYGTAVFKEDYRLEPVSAGGAVRIPAGFASIPVRLYPIDDTLVEGTESADVKLILPPFANPLPPPYSIDAAHASVAMVIHDNELNLPVVSLSANNSWRTGEPCPVCFVVPGVLTVSRTGPTTGPLSVFLTYDGTATANVDYQALPLIVTIPAGTNSTELLVLGIDDLLVEGPEVVRARLLATVAGGSNLGGYRINEQANEALVVIGDNEPGAPSLRLDLIEPPAGGRFSAGAIVKLSALGVWTEGELDHAVEFLAGGTVIGHSSPPSLDRPTIPGLPSVHTSFWTNPPSGEHSLTARFAATTTLAVTSPPVHITVGTGNNALPAVAIVRPQNGASLPAGGPVEIVVETRDPDGYVPLVRFFADGRKIGEANIQFFREPEPGQLQTFTFAWNNAAAGKHVLTAQATDNRGGVGSSLAVLIEIGSADALPEVTLVARDAWAVEPDSNTNLNTATFRIRRSGPTNQPLVIAYSLSGTAENGTDYEILGSTATIPAGRRSVLVTIRPRPDTLREGLETVILRLQQANAVGNYEIGRPSVAIALISDGPPSPPWPRCAALPGGMIHVCFAAEPAQSFRLEASIDLRGWETISDALSSDGAWHFVDGEMDLHPQRFYRITPEPVVELDE